jgi:hypothetical protein
VSPKDKPLAWLSGEVKTPPFSKEARIEAGFFLRRLQRGESLSMPNRARCQALRHDATNYESTTAAATGV